MAYLGDIALGCLFGVRLVIRAGIPGLFSASGPAAILWRVWTVVVNALNSVLVRRPFAHIGEEVFKRIAPAVANKNSPTAPICKAVVIRVVAALLDAAPCIPLWPNATTPGHPMGRKPRRPKFSTKTSATDAAPIPQGSAVNISCRSAVANARPLSIARVLCGGPSSKALSGDVVKFWHTSSLPHEERFAWRI